MRKLLFFILVTLPLIVASQPPGPPPNLPPPLPNPACNGPHPPPGCVQVPLADNIFFGILFTLAIWFTYKKFRKSYGY